VDVVSAPLGLPFTLCVDLADTEPRWTTVSSSAAGQTVVLERFRDFWKPWSQDPLYFRMRRVYFGIMTPALIAFTFLMLIVQQWTMAALGSAGATIAVISILRTPWRQRDRSS